jgi:dTDP-3-amino-3,4,6-trideoxy-alpha-D-glucose transaminase
VAGLGQPEAAVEGVAPGSEIRFLDLGRRAAAMGPELREGFDRVLGSGQVLWGPELAAFEREWAEFTGRRFAVGVGSGTDALRLSLVALDIGPGDEVIVPAFTAIPTVAAVCAAGAVPVPVDVDPETASLDPAAARAALGERTRAVVVVHLYGRPAELPDLGLPVIEDAAHAHGAVSGAGGVAAAYSFYPTKNLGGVGDGGAVVTDDAELAARIGRLRAHGRDETGRFQEISTNSRLSELEAAALRVALRRLDAGNRRRAEIAAAYREAAGGLRWHPDHERHAYHLCVARIPDRESFRARMPFDVPVHYPYTVTDEPAYAHLRRDDTPNADAWAAECVSLPCYPELTDEEVERVCAALA